MTKMMTHMNQSGMMMTKSKKEYRYVVTYTEGEGWWFTDPTGLFWEGSNIFDFDKGEFLEPNEIDDDVAKKEVWAADKLSRALEALN